MSQSHAFKSTHPAVLEAWQKMTQHFDQHTAVVQEIKAETGRDIYTVTGWGDGRSLGLSCGYNEEPPPGWKWHQSKRSSGIIMPRAKGPGVADAERIMQRLWASDPKPRKMMHDLFDAPEFTHHGLIASTPAIVQFGQTVWIYYGDYEYQDSSHEWDGGDFFVKVPLSEWYAAKEEQDAEDARLEAEQEAGPPRASTTQASTE